MPLAWYRARILSRPMATQAVTTGLLFGGGDILAQSIANGKAPAEIDWMRTLRNSSYGFLFFGPAVGIWYRILQRMSIPNYPKLEVPARVLADQIVFTPIHLTAFFTYNALLEGKDFKQRLREKFWPTIRKNWMLWPAVQMINFAFIPVEFRSLFVNVIALAWNAYLSMANAGTTDAIARKR